MEQAVEAKRGPESRAIIEDLQYTLALQAFLVTLTDPARGGFAVVTCSDGADRLAVFASEEDFRSVFPSPDPNELSALISFSEIIQFLQVRSNIDGIVIDPGSIAWVVNRKDMLALSEKRKNAPRMGRALRIPAGATVVVGDPAEYPEEMAKVLADYASGQRRIKKMWLRLLLIDDELTYLLVIKAAGNIDDLFRGLAKAAQDYVDRPLDMITHDVAFGPQATSGTKPFYRRGIF